MRRESRLSSTIPSREVLLGKLLGSIQSPITNFARVIKQIAETAGGLIWLYDMEFGSCVENELS